MAGANQIYGAGMIESGVTFDFGQLVMDNEFARMIKYAVAGIPVDDDTLAVEDIAKVGAFGDFLSLDATLKHMRELSQPVILDRRVREDWEARGSQDLASVARARGPGAHRVAPAAAARPGHGEADPRHHRGRRPRERCGMKDQLKQAVIDGNADTALALTQALIATGVPAREVLDEALLPGMEVVGERMREAEIFIPEVLLSARVMQACLDLLRPHMAAGEDAGMGTRRARHRRGRPARHRQEPRRHDAAGRRLHGRQPRHRGDQRPVRRRRPASTSRRSSA